MILDDLWIASPTSRLHVKPMPRFKIDYSGSSSAYYLTVYRRVPGRFWGWKWEKLDICTSLDEARATIRKIKDLPEYIE